ncbi:hypothetical protein IU447_24215 [Nocardia farcinica]|uniref:hypothetical protein n=1 Tax=Nocardia farcinica TaxID=37329 RepID=UPI001893CC8D|nr:hypothetical protein [Nocardia farcinica]MBF6363225.1 hypothetical protein [Nocardia farcinica]
MSFLLRRNLPWAWAGWRDLDAEHARPDENPIKPPWKRTNMARSVWLQGNELRIADYSETVFQVGGVSYEQMCYTPEWGAEYDLNVDGNIIQLQFWGAAISSSWSKVGFSDLLNVPIVVVYRDAVSAVNTVRIIVYRNASTIETLASTQAYSGLMQRSWWRMKIRISLDHLVRVYYNDILLLQHWLPNSLAAGPNRRALSFLNQTSATSYQKNFRLGDYPPEYQILRPSQWAEIFADDFNRPDGAVGNGWTQFGVNAEIRSGSWTTIGTTNGNRAILRNSGNVNGVQRVEGILGGFIDPTTGYSSLIVRGNAEGTLGLIGTFADNDLRIARYTSILSGGTVEAVTYVTTADYGILDNNLPVAFCANGQFAWLEIDGEVVLLCEITTGPTGSWMGARVQRDGVNSASWNSIRLMEAL